MLEHIFQINHDFRPWTADHYIPVMLFLFLGWWFITSAQSWPARLQWKIPFLLSLLLPATIVLWIIARLTRGEFDVTEDLPLHMCNLVTFFIPLIFYKRIRVRWIFGIVYFWVLSGTLQAVITPGLEQTWPHYYYFRYWIVHCGLVIFILYAVVVLRFVPTWRDVWNAIIAMNVLFVLAYLVNTWLGSNYLYTMRKPEQSSLLDYFGPWPVYILVSEVVGLGFFILYYLPFMKKNRRAKGH